MLDMLDTQLANLKVDNLSRTIQFVVSPVRFQKAEFEEKLAASLNRWARSESEFMNQDDWKLDTAMDSVLEKYGTIETVQRVSELNFCLLYTSPSPRDRQKSRMPSSA